MKLTIKEKQLNKIIESSYQLLKYRKIFEEYDKRHSLRQEHLNAVLYANEFQQLRMNQYFPQSEINLQTHYKKIFDNISHHTVKLLSKDDKEYHLKKIIHLLAELNLDIKYLKQSVFSNVLYDYPHKVIPISSFQLSPINFIRLRNLLSTQIKSYLQLSIN